MLEPSGDKRKTVIELVLGAYLAGSPTYKQELDDEFRTFAIHQIRLFAFLGQPSTCATMVYALHLLSSNPAALDDLRTEHDQVLGPDPAGPVLSAQPQLLNQLRYTKAVIKETCRLFPGGVRDSVGRARRGARRRRQHALAHRRHLGVDPAPAPTPRPRAVGTARSLPATALACRGRRRPAASALGRVAAVRVGPAELHQPGPRGDGAGHHAGHDRARVRSCARVCRLRSQASQEGDPGLARREGISVQGRRRAAAGRISVPRQALAHLGIETSSSKPHTLVGGTSLSVPKVATRDLHRYQ